MLNKTLHLTVFLVTTIFFALALHAVPVHSQPEIETNASFSFEPSPTTVLNKDSVIPFTVSVNSGDQPINVVSLTIQYDQSDLEFVSVNGTTSAFEFAAPTQPSGNGVVFITRGTPTEGGLTGTNQVAIVNFRVLDDAGSTTLSIGGDSNIIRVGAVDIWNGNTEIGTYNLLPASADSPSETPAPTGGENLVAIRVTDENNQPLRRKVVTIGERTTTTDESGVANFGAIPAGQYDVVVSEEDGSILLEEEVTVSSELPSTEVQQFDLQVDDSGSSVWVVLLVLLLLAGIVLALIFIRKRNGFSKKKVDDTPLYYDIDTIQRTNNNAMHPNSGNYEQSPPGPGDEINPNQ